MREPFISLFLLALPILAISIYNIIAKKNKMVFPSKTMNYVLLVTSSVILIYCIIPLVLAFVRNIEIKAIWPSNAIFALAIFLFFSGIIEIILKKRHSVRPDYFTLYSGFAYTLIIIIWWVVGLFY